MYWDNWEEIDQFLEERFATRGDFRLIIATDGLCDWKNLLDTCEGGISVVGEQRMYLLRNLLLDDFHNSLRWCVFPLQSRLLKYVRSRRERNVDVLGPGGEARNNSRTPPLLQICPRIRSPTHCGQ